MGVWIETLSPESNVFVIAVTPCMGVWIETEQEKREVVDRWSLPVWECGLKHEKVD